MMSPRRIGSAGRIARSKPVSVGANTILFTSRWSPISRLFSIEPVGILNACTTNVRTKSARITATHSDSKYSRGVDFLNRAGGGGAAAVFAFTGGMPCRLFLVFADLQHRQERFLRYFHASHPFHAPLALFLLLEQLALAGDVSTIALGQYVLAERFHAFACDHTVADRGLDGHLEHLPWNELPHLGGQGPAALVGGIAVDDDR